MSKENTLISMTYSGCYVFSRPSRVNGFYFSFFAAARLPAGAKASYQAPAGADAASNHVGRKSDFAPPGRGAERASVCVETGGFATARVVNEGTTGIVLSRWLTRCGVGEDGGGDRRKNKSEKHDHVG
jgi:hypothetical protein